MIACRACVGFHIQPIGEPLLSQITEKVSLNHGIGLPPMREGDCQPIVPWRGAFPLLLQGSLSCKRPRGTPCVTHLLLQGFCFLDLIGLCLRGRLSNPGLLAYETPVLGVDPRSYCLAIGQGTDDPLTRQGSFD